MRHPHQLAVAGVLAAGLLAFALSWRPGAGRPAPSRSSAGLATVAEAAPPDTPRAPSLAPLPARYRGQLVRKRVRYFPHKLLALTFDDGPDPRTTPLALQALQQYQARATFFVLGKCARAYPELVKQTAAAGHAVENHSYSHPSSTSAARAVQELALTTEAVTRLTGRRPTLFRPPYGITGSNLCRAAQRQGYGVVLWTVSSADSNPISAATIARNVIHTPNPGDIVLMHDGAGHRASMAALPQILKELSATGFRFVTVPELLAQWDKWLAAQKAPQGKGH